MIKTLFTFQSKLDEIKRLRERGALGTEAPSVAERINNDAQSKKLIINGKPARQVGRFITELI